MKSIANLEFSIPWSQDLSRSEGQKEIIDHEPDVEPDCGCNHGFPCAFHDCKEAVRYLREVMNRRL